MSQNEIVYFFIDWCPCEHVRFQQRDITEPYIQPIVKISYPKTEEHIIEKVLSEKGARIHDLKCAARNDGLLIFSMRIESIRLPGRDQEVKPDFVRIARYVSKKLKEKILNHSHVFHSSALSDVDSHFPVYINQASILATTNKNDFHIENYINSDRQDKIDILQNIISNDRILTTLKASHNSGIDSNRLALDVLCFHISNQACLAKHTIEKLIATRKDPKTTLDDEIQTSTALHVLAAIVTNLVIIYFWEKYYLYQTLVLFSCALVISVYRINQSSISTQAINGARLIATNSIGYAYSALHFSSIYNDLMLSSRLKERKVQSLKSINDARIMSSIEKLNILLRRIERRIQEDSDKSTFYMTVCGVTVAALGIAAAG